MDISALGKIAPQSLVDVVEQRLEAAIIEGTLAPGSRLSEHGLAATLGVSRGPLREAIRRLEGRRLVQRTPNIGVRVAMLSHDDLQEVLQVREVLEGLACGLATTRMSDGDLEALETLLDEHANQMGLKVGLGYFQEGKDHDFHFRIAMGSGNARLISMLCEDLYDILRVYRYRSSTVGNRSQRALDEHRAILQAMRSRDSALADARMREHIRNARVQQIEEFARKNDETAA